MFASRRLERLLVRAEVDPDVLAVMLFGSRARGDAAESSDVDVCLVARRGSGANLTEMRIAYAGEFDLDVQVFQVLPLPLRSRVLKEGRVLLVADEDEDELYELAIRTIKEFEDFKPYYRRYVEAVLGD